MKRPHKHILSLLSILLMLLIPCITPIHIDAATAQLKVHYIDVGESDCTLVQFGSTYMMIDAGDTDDTSTVLSYLKSKNIKKLEYLILTHPHADHIGSAADVINQYDIGKILMPAVEHTTQTYEDVLNAIADKKMKITKPVVGDSYQLGDASFTILAPNNYSYGNDINNYSIGLKLTYNKNSFLFIGDAETEAISDLLKNGYDLSADVYLCGHHGSDTSTTQELLESVHPKSAVISVGKNSYGHPGETVLNMLSKDKIDIYRTDKSGTIVATSNGKKITFSASPTKASDKSDAALGKGKPSSTVSSEEHPADSNITYVYVTKTGSKYHKEGCRYLRSSMIKIPLTDAESKGYEPCSVCN